MSSHSEIFTHVYANGLTLVAERMPHVRSAAFRLLLAAGIVNDPEGMEGAAQVLWGLSFRGAGSRDSRQLSDALDNLGLQRNGGVGDELTTFGGALLGDDLLSALAIYADIVRNPHLPGDQLAAEQALALQELDSLEENPTQKTFVLLRRAFFPGLHGRCQLGTREGIGSLDIGKVHDEQIRRYSSPGAILSVAGNFQWEALVEETGRLFGDWGGVGHDRPKLQTEGRQPYSHVDHPSNQEQIGVAYDAIPPGDERYYDALMSVQVLSGGMAARLFTEVREKRGLVYSVFASYQSLKDFGFVLSYAGTTPERSQETLDVLLKELQRLSDGVSTEEVERGKTGLLSRLVMSGESTSARASSIAADYHLRGKVRTIDEIRSAIEAVTPDSVGEFLQHHPPKDFTVATLGPAELKYSIGSIGPP